MTLHRTFAAGTAATVVFALVAVPAGPVHAHGATTDPVSRVAACGPEGGARRAAVACRAAAGGADFAAWDNLRVADVAGRDRARIPDGRLCSAGLPQYRALDEPRADWPSTRLTPGARYTFTYRGTIAHRGSFRLYVTNPDYDPRRPLRWSDLGAEPFLTVVDPPLRDGSYRLPGRLPADRAGRHLIYAVWQNSDTPDTYYSCSDVVFQTGGAAAAPPAAGAAPGRSGSARPAPPEPTAAAVAGAAGGEPADGFRARLDGQPAEPISGAPAEDGHGPLVVAGLAAVLAVGTALAALRRSRRNRQPSSRTGQG